MTANRFNLDIDVDTPFFRHTDRGKSSTELLRDTREPFIDQESDRLFPVSLLNLLRNLERTPRSANLL